jgi:hypothetical protein
VGVRLLRRHAHGRRARAAPARQARRPRQPHRHRCATSATASMCTKRTTRARRPSTRADVGRHEPFTRSSPSARCPVA